MVEDANDPQHVPLYFVEDAMAAVRQAPNWWIYFQAQGTRFGVTPQQVKCPFEASQVICTFDLSERFDAVFQYAGKIGGGGRSKPDFKHAVRR